MTCGIDKKELENIKRRIAKSAKKLAMYIDCISVEGDRFMF